MFAAVAVVSSALRVAALDPKAPHRLVKTGRSRRAGDTPESLACLFDAKVSGYRIPDARSEPASAPNSGSVNSQSRGTDGRCAGPIATRPKRWRTHTRRAFGTSSLLIPVARCEQVRKDTSPQGSTSTAKPQRRIPQATVWQRLQGCATVSLCIPCFACC